MRPWRVVEGLDQRMALERCLDDSALHADTAAVNQPHFPQTRRVRRVHVFLDD
jgi:hypothetical protein